MLFLCGMRNERILLISTNDLHKAMFDVAMSNTGFKITVFTHALEALNFVTMMTDTREAIALLVLEPPLNELTADQFITKLRGAGLDTPVLLIANLATGDEAVEASRHRNVHKASERELTTETVKLVMNIFHVQSTGNHEGE